jgi:hypothetical protein
MTRLTLIALVTFMAAHPFKSYADTNADAIAAVARDVQEVCTQPAKQGEHWQITGDASAEGGINLKMLKLGSIGGNLHFSKEEWSGVQQVLAADRAHDNADYRKCVEVLTPQFLSKISTVNTANNCTNSNCAGINTGEQNIYFGGYAAPLERVISPEKFAAATKVLQTAPHGAQVFLNYSAKDGVNEIERFYNQVTGLFGQSDHWIVAGTQHIGASMMFADGGQRTGEGVGCSMRNPPTEAGRIAEEAMIATGFPCTREAADWGGRNNDEKGNRKPELMDIVISIGTRFIPPS